MFRNFLAAKAVIKEDGSIKLPEEFLNSLGWTENTLIQIEYEPEGKCLVVMAPYEYCCICGTSENPFFTVMGKNVCEDCQQLVSDAKIDKKKILNGQIEDGFEYTKDE